MALYIPILNYLPLKQIKFEVEAISPFTYILNSDNSFTQFSL